MIAICGFAVVFDIPPRKEGIFFVASTGKEISQLSPPRREDVVVLSVSSVRSCGNPFAWRGGLVSEFGKASVDR